MPDATLIRFSPLYAAINLIRDALSGNDSNPPKELLLAANCLDAGLQVCVKMLCANDQIQGAMTMSLARFNRKLKLIDVRDADRKWFPKWIDGYVRFHRLDPDRQLEVSESMVIQFLQSLRDNRYPAWRREQAARAIEAYQN